MSAEHEIRKGWYVGYLICVLCFVFTIWSFYPGMMSPDSVMNLSDGRSGHFSDINAPLMSYVWGVLDGIVAGPGLMLVLQCAIFWGACALLWKTASKESFWLGIALVLFGLMPHILAQTVVIWKDIALGASLLMAVALIFYSQRTGSKLALLMSPIFLFYGYAARLNALPAVLPIAIWAGFVAVRILDIRSGKFVPFLIGTAHFVTLSIAVFAVNGILTEGRTVYPFQQIYLYDLAAISIKKDAPTFPGYIIAAENFSLDGVKTRYNTRSVSGLIFPDIPNVGDKPVLKLTDRPEEVSELKTKCWEAIMEEPGTYLVHRTRIFGQLVGLDRAVTAPYWEQGFVSSPPEFRPQENAGTWALTKYFVAFRRPFAQTLFFRAIIWLVLCGFFLFEAIRRKLGGDWELVFVLSISSLLFTAAYFPTTPSTEFRYLFWPAIASAVAIIFGIYLLRREKHLKLTDRDQPV